jgi:TPR repeat protein
MNTNPTNAREQCELGKKYASGDGMPRDFRQAASWYIKAAEQGDADAQLRLGLLYFNGHGVLKDQKKAASLYKEAAEQGHAEAQRQLADSYFMGDGVPQDMEEANKWYTKAAEQGNVDAQYCLGNNYFNGDGVPKNPEKSFYWYTQAAELGNAYAQFNIGSDYFNGDGVLKNYKEAQRWLIKAIEQGVEPGMDVACYFVGKSYDRGGYDILANKKEAVNWYTKAAKLGNRASQVRLGEIYLKGAEGVPINTEKANYWRTQADGPQDKRITASEWVESKLMEMGANASAIDLVTKAMAEDRLDVLDYLVINGMDVNTKFADGGTLMHVAASNGHVGAMKWLQKHNVSIYEPTNNGKKPIHLANSGGHSEAVKWLQDNGEYIDTKVSPQNKTPMNKAAVIGSDKADVLRYGEFIAYDIEEII